MHYKQLYWKKRRTVRWVQFGDENTKFFHTLATESYKKNTIAQLATSDGRIVTEHHDKAAVLWHAFRDRMGVTANSHVFFLSGQPY